MKKITLALSLLILSISLLAQQQAVKNVKLVLELVKEKGVKYTVKIDNRGFKYYFINRKGFKFKKEDQVFLVSKGRKKVGIKFYTKDEYYEEVDSNTTIDYVKYLDIHGFVLGIESNSDKLNEENYIIVNAEEIICFL
jgi:hypothetical protein